MKDLEGKEVVVFCANYIYAGTFVSISHDLLTLENASIVYETGDFSAKNWKDAQRLPTKLHFIERSAIESMGAVERQVK